MVDVDWPSAVMAIGVGRDRRRRGRGCGYIKSHVRIIGDGSAIDGARDGSGAKQQHQLSTWPCTCHHYCPPRAPSAPRVVASTTASPPAARLLPVGILGLHRDGRRRLAIGRNGDRVGRDRCRLCSGCNLAF